MTCFACRQPVHRDNKLYRVNCANVSSVHERQRPQHSPLLRREYPKYPEKRISDYLKFPRYCGLRRWIWMTELHPIYTSPLISYMSICCLCNLTNYSPRYKSQNENTHHAQPEQKHKWIKRSLLYKIFYHWGFVLLGWSSYRGELVNLAECFHWPTQNSSFVRSGWRQFFHATPAGSQAMTITFLLHSEPLSLTQCKSSAVK